MKRIVVTALSFAMVITLAACGNDKPTELTEDTEISESTEVKEETKTKEKAETKKQAEEVVKVETKDKEDADAYVAPTVEELSKVYAEYISKIAGESDTAEELVFTTADTNNDGVKELLYAESGVNAAGVYVCFYDKGQINAVGPFGCYGGIKYAPKSGEIISVMDNMDYMTYELVAIDDKYEQSVKDKFEIEPNSEGDGYYFFLDDEEVTEEAYADAFAVLKDMDVRSIDYYDMYWYVWCNSDSEPIEQRLNKMISGEEVGRDCHMFIPMEEKAKLIGTWQMYSSEIEGEISYASDGSVGGKITVHEDYTVDLDYGKHKMKGMRMDFYNGSFNDYADNQDWYVVIDAYEEDETTVYMNVSDTDQLTVNTIGEGETLVSLWDIYDRVK